MTRSAALSPRPNLRELSAAFWRIGLLSFGGPAAQIALLHRVVLDEKRWISEADYTRALSFCMLLPGPEAMQLATWIGWRLRGITGGVIAGGLFVLPGAVLILALAAIYTGFGSLPVVPLLFTGIQAAVVAIVIGALIRLSRRALQSRESQVIALLSFAALFFFALPFPLILALAALWGVLQTRRDGRSVPVVMTPPPPLAHSLRDAAIWLALWLLPLGLLVAFGPVRLAEIGLFFSKLAALAFGGAYALMAWMSQEMVEINGWLSAGQMIDGLALAESTPGPLILVTVFTGWLAGFQDGGSAMAFAGGLVALWMTFLPSFLFIFAASPFIDRLLSVPALASAMARITPAVTGVIAHLSLWFTIHVLFSAHFEVNSGPFHMTLPLADSLKPLPLLLASASCFALLYLRLPMLLVLFLAATASFLAGPA